MIFPHIFRNISRTFAKATVREAHFYEKWLRVLLITVVISSLVMVVTNPKPNINVEDSTPQVKGQKNTLDANSQLQKALNHTLSFTKTKDASEIEKAIGSLQTSLQLDPNDAYALRLLETLTKENQPRIREQIEKTVEILKRRPDYSAAWLRLAILYQQLGENNLANEALSRAKKINSNW